jgi:hypothetical protein
MRKLNLVLTSLLIAGGLQGCLRGETQTLQEILDASRSRYQYAVKSGSTQESLNEAAKLLAQLEKSSATTAIAADSKKLVDALTALTAHAGFTSRPALTELVDQYRVLAGKGATDRVTTSQVKLLVTRTYNALASEMEGTRFSL